MLNSYQKFQNAVSIKNTMLCIGLDSDVGKLPSPFAKVPQSIVEFNKEIINATQEHAAAYKINFAFYEQYGVQGFEIIRDTIDSIPKDIFIIADAKRGDIGNTSKSYAKSIFEVLGADSITANPYMGHDSVAPFFEYTDKFTFLLGLTSNKGSQDFQKLLVDGRELYKIVVQRSMEWANCEQLGFVVGATHPDQLAELRSIAPDRLFLIPGIGAQGGDIESVVKANGNAPALINSSRAIIYASNGNDFAYEANEMAKFYSQYF